MFNEKNRSRNMMAWVYDRAPGGRAFRRASGCRFAKVMRISQMNDGSFSSNK